MLYIPLTIDNSLPANAPQVDDDVVKEISVPTLWENALGQLLNGQRKILHDFGIQNPSTIEVEIGTIRELRDSTTSLALSRGTEDKKPTLTRARIHSILRKLEKYMIIGDIALQQNPNIVSLVWAGVRFCLQVCQYTFASFMYLPAVKEPG